MTTMTQSVSTPFSIRQHRPLTTAALVVLFWIAAAILVITTHLEIDPRSPITGGVMVIIILIAAAFSYTRLVARTAGVNHALGVGIAWLTLSIATEIAFTTRLRHGWFTLLGSPDHPLLRNIFLFVWIFAPAFFARREELF